jgi:micrococcal nuclease
VRLLLAVLLTLASPAGLARVTVSRVVDGDTVRMTYGGDRVRVRLLGIDTPEVEDSRAVVRCLAAAATRRTTALAAGRTVSVELDPSQARFDQYGRLLAYLWLPDGTMLNERLVAEGYAHEYTYRLPYKYRNRFRTAEKVARTRKLGLWSSTACR